MNTRISINETQQIDLILWNEDTNTPLAQSYWFENTQATSDNAVVPEVVDAYTVNVFGSVQGTGTVHITTTAHFTIDGVEYVVDLSLDRTYDCVPKPPVVSLRQSN